MEKVRKRVMTNKSLLLFKIFFFKRYPEKTKELFHGLQGLKYVNQDVIQNSLRRALMMFFHDEIAPSCEKRGVDV